MASEAASGWKPGEGCSTVVMPQNAQVSLVMKCGTDPDEQHTAGQAGASGGTR